MVMVMVMMLIPWLPRPHSPEGPGRDLPPSFQSHCEALRRLDRSVRHLCSSIAPRIVWASWLLLLAREAVPSQSTAQQRRGFEKGNQWLEQTEQQLLTVEWGHAGFEEFAERLYYHIEGSKRNYLDRAAPCAPSPPRDCRGELLFASAEDHRSTP